MKKDVDATIERLLEKYRYHMLRLLTKETCRVTCGLWRNKIEREKARKRLRKINVAFALLQEIVANPRRYLYWDFDIAHNGLYEDGMPGRKLSEEDLKMQQSILKQLQPLEFLENNRSKKMEKNWGYKELDVIPVLSESIAYHFTPHRNPMTKKTICDGNVDEKYEMDWVCKSCKNIGYPESEIFDLSKYVSAVTGSRVGASVKYMMPRKWFAKNYRPNKER